METLSFILGIASVVVITNVIVTVVSFVKVIKVKTQHRELEDLFSYTHEKNNKEIDHRFKEIYDLLSREIDILNNRIDNFERETFSQMDSRMDRLDNKYKREIENIYTLVNNNKN